jgi:Holliday junction DNA helicase RuvB
LDVILSPQTLDDFAGQELAKTRLRILIDAARTRREVVEHILVYGPAGVGKTTLAYVIANEIGARIKVMDAHIIEDAGHMAAILTNLHKGDVLFVDLLHQLNQEAEQVLYSAMEEFTLHSVIGKGPTARIVALRLPPFTLIGAATELGSVSYLLRTRFGAICGLDYYDADAMEQIVRRSARAMGISIEDQAAQEIASKAGGMPRQAHRLLRRVRDYVEVRVSGVITEAAAQEALALLQEVE